MEAQSWVFAIMILIRVVRHYPNPNSWNSCGCTEQSHVEEMDVLSARTGKQRKDHPFCRAACLAIVIFGWRMRWDGFCGVCIGFKPTRGLVPKWEYPPVDGIEETHELEGCWPLVRLFVQAGIP
jgi:hypothetical protein